MKILLDECVTKKLRPYLANHEVYTVTEMGWSGLKNGKLMAKCVEHQFQVLLTIDKNLMYQQNLKNYELSIIVLHSHTSKIEELKEFIPALEKQLPFIEFRKAYLIEK